MSDSPQTTDQDTKVWAVCDYLRGANVERCNGCPEHVEVEGHGRGTPGCYLHALRLVNVVEAAVTETTDAKIARLRARVAELERLIADMVI